MRTLWAVLLLAGSTFLTPASVGAAVGVQQVFLGRMTCGPDATGCVFPDVLSAHRYLHVLVHDIGDNADWQVRAGPDCASLGGPVLGGLPTTTNGYLEQVLDVSTLKGQSTAFSGCLSFEGRGKWAVSYYAAWFDDNPATDADVVFPGFLAIHDRAAMADLDVTYIHRSPEKAYDVQPSQPSRGDRVTFTAHVRNSGSEIASGFDYVWSLDGRDVAYGAYMPRAAPGEEFALDFSWTWDPAPHQLGFRIIPHGDDLSSTNDTLVIRTEALSLGFWVEESAYTFFADHQYLYCRDKSCAGSDSFPDWLQRQVTKWNQALADAVYPGFVPGGIADRVRLDAIHVVPDGALPLAGNFATNTPDTRDHSVDLEWGLPWSSTRSTYRLSGDRAFDVDWGLIHELGHARYLTDLYRFDVPTNSSVTIAVHGANGAPVVDPANPLDLSATLHAYPDAEGIPFYYRNAEQDLMSCTCTHGYSAYTAMTLNRIRGQRARCGNVNTPCNIGEWFGEIPADTRLRIEDRLGDPLADGTEIRTFFDTGTGYTGHAFSDADRSTMRLNHGIVDLGSDPFRSRSSKAYAPQHTLLLEVRAPFQDMFCFLEPSDFNSAYWLGHRDRAHPATLTVQLGGQRLNGCNPALGDSIVNEPFAVSPFRSTAHLGLPTSDAHAREQLLTVRLVGDGPAADPMFHRIVVAKNALDQVVARSSTGSTGVATMRVQVGSVQTVVDRTDNNLTIAAEAGDYPRLRVQRR